MIRKLKQLIPALFLLVPMIVLAAGDPGKILGPIDSSNLGLPGISTDTLGGQIIAFVKLFLQIIGWIAVGFLLYGGFQYITSGGNEEKAKQAKKTITNSIIGLLIIILSFIIVTIITNAAFGRV